MERIRIGVKGLDEMSEGGFPKGKCVLLVGGPGSGKTIFAMQFLKSGAEGDERGLYVTLDEKPEQVKEEMKAFGWNIDKLESDGKIILLDATPLRRSRMRGREEGKNVLTVTLPELTLQSLINTISKIVEEENIQRIAVDPITSLVIRYGDVDRRRKAVLSFFDALIQTMCTSLVTAELRTSQLDRSFQLEEFLSQGVILLHNIVHEGNVIKALQIEKMRGIKHDTQLRPYRITGEGIEVFSKDQVF